MPRDLYPLRTPRSPPVSPRERLSLYLRRAKACQTLPSASDFVRMLRPRPYAPSSSDARFALSVARVERSVTPRDVYIVETGYYRSSIAPFSSIDSRLSSRKMPP
ncbi:Hypothetical protein NTJ_15119 [Nesidiocoris tenuis]|uniref:Uncharacterized protein n=1 Tax=Nesidiocoris tenuis TaxID=355587 RepID=A0ABN7BF56_9HEMI|nr:Hypothetical protein NTJ_15119 [Nesidiocoris tenuis]